MAWLEYGLPGIGLSSLFQSFPLTLPPPFSGRFALTFPEYLLTLADCEE
jgi:hypothetical protein